jgi:hypothetical protein
MADKHGIILGHAKIILTAKPEDEKRLARISRENPGMPMRDFKELSEAGSKERWGIVREMKRLRTDPVTVQLLLKAKVPREKRVEVVAAVKALQDIGHSASVDDIAAGLRHGFEEHRKAVEMLSHGHAKEQVVASDLLDIGLDKVKETMREHGLGIPEAVQMHRIGPDKIERIIQTHGVDARKALQLYYKIDDLEKTMREHGVDLETAEAMHKFGLELVTRRMEEDNLSPRDAMLAELESKRIRADLGKIEELQKRAPLSEVEALKLAKGVPKGVQDEIITIMRQRNKTFKEAVEFFIENLKRLK